MEDQEPLEPGAGGPARPEISFFELVLDNVPDMVFLKRANDLTYAYTNRAAREFAGVLPGTLAGKSDLDTFETATALRQQARDRQVLATGQPWQAREEPFDSPRGRRWFWARSIPIPSATGEPEFILTIARDATREHELRLISLAWYEFFYNAAWGIVAWSAHTMLLERMNPAFAHMHGYTVEELEGKPYLEVFAPEVRAEVAALIESTGLEGHVTFESVHIRKDGTTFPVLADATAIRDEEKNPVYWAVNVQDVTQLKETEVGLRAARAEAERANRATSEFLSRMSHELRTPLNVVLGFAQVLQLDELSPDQEESVGHILEAGRHLLALIDDVLEISRLESGGMALSVGSVGVLEVVEEVLNLMRPLAARTGVTLGHAAEDCRAYVLADRQRLKQIVLNLVSNGIKYNVPGGTVSIECNDDGASVAISVIDTGIGLPEGVMGRLFAPFDRLGREATEVEGTGLGLSLCRGLAEAMGGKISAARGPETGSIFTVVLKRAERPEENDGVPRTEVASRRQSAGLVLYIEDNLANFRLIERVLSRRPGVGVVAAMQGGLGLQLARDHHPDLILLDLHLPDIAGEEVLRRLLHDPQTATTPVIIASADATPRTVQRLQRLGARAFLTKPIDVRKLLETLDEFLPTHGA